MNAYNFDNARTFHCNGGNAPKHREEISTILRLYVPGDSYLFTLYWQDLMDIIGDYQEDNLDSTWFVGDFVMWVRENPAEKLQNS